VERRCDRFRPMASDISALSSIAANGQQVVPTAPPLPLIIPYSEFSPIRLEPPANRCRALPGPLPAPFDAVLAVLSVPSSESRRLGPRLCPQALGSARFIIPAPANATTARCASLANSVQLGLVRLALVGLCPCGPFASPSLFCSVILCLHAATSTPLPDRVHFDGSSPGHKSLHRSYHGSAVPKEPSHRFQRRKYFRGGSHFVLLRPAGWLERLTGLRRRFCADRPARLQQSLPQPGSPLPRVCYRYLAQPSIAEAGLAPASMSKVEGCT